MHMALDDRNTLLREWPEANQASCLWNHRNTVMQKGWRSCGAGGRQTGGADPVALPFKHKVDVSGTEMAEVVAWLRREKETLEVQKSLAEQEAARWRSQASHSERAAAEAREVRCRPLQLSTELVACTAINCSFDLRATAVPVC